MLNTFLLILFQVTVAPYKYLAEIPGKEVRSMLISCFNKWLLIQPEQLKKIKEVIQMLHNASLLYVFFLTVPFPIIPLNLHLTPPNYFPLIFLSFSLV